MTDDWDDDLDEDDIDNDDVDDERVSYYYICPECGFEVYADCPVCPACEMYIVPVLTERSSLRPMWYVFLGLAGIIGTVIVLSGVMNFFR